jgi:2-keto-4-pentenoate hydratase/2-oxohepta-3-ene-1,7-dioic acid hydratase in catechol pathway
VKAIRFCTSDDGDPRIGALEGDTIRDAGPAGAAGFVPDERGWAAIAAASGAEHALADVRVLHPVVPGKILAIGINYRTHARETGIDGPSVPVLFAKFPSALIGHGDDIVVPREETRPDYEGELAVVIGRRTYRAGRAGARAAIGGISVMNDVSGRRAQMETPLRQFTLGKSYDTFAPMGPCIASADGVDLADVDVRTWVSGELRQEANTSDLIFAVEDLIVYLSAGTTLEPGDVIATGTPGGVGDWHDPPRYLREGDVVEIEVGGVGRLRNGVRMER